MILNNSGWHPVGRAVLVMPEALVKKDSVIALPQSVTDRTKLMQDRAQVVAVGAAAWMDEPEARAKPGDNVILAAFSGYILLGKDGKEYRAVNERDIFLVEDKGDQND